MYIGAFACIYQCEGMGPLEQELQTVESCHWVLGIEPRSSEREINALNHWAISPAPCCCYLFIVQLTMPVPGCRGRRNLPRNTQLPFLVPKWRQNEELCSSYIVQVSVELIIQSRVAWTLYVARVGLRLRIPLPLLPEYWHYRCVCIP